MDVPTEVVEGIEDNFKGLEPPDAEVGLLHIRVNAHVWVESAGCLGCHLGYRCG